MISNQQKLLVWKMVMFPTSNFNKKEPISSRLEEVAVIIDKAVLKLYFECIGIRFEL